MTMHVRAKGNVDGSFLEDRVFCGDEMLVVGLSSRSRYHGR